MAETNNQAGQASAVSRLQIVAGEGIAVPLEHVTILRSAQGGGDFWGELFQEVIRNNEGLSRFLPRAIPSAQRVLFQKLEDGREVASRSRMALPGQIPQREIQGLNEAMREFKRLAESPSCDPDKKKFIESFKVPDADKMPECYRIYRHRGKRRLLVLWGLEWRQGNAGSIPPEAAAGQLEVLGMADRRPWLRRAIAFLVVLIVLLAIGMLAFYLWQHMSPPKRPTGPTSTTGTRPPRPSSAGTTSRPATTAKSPTDPNHVQTRPAATTQTRPVAPPQTRPAVPPQTRPAVPPHTVVVIPVLTQPVTPPQTRPVAPPSSTQPVPPPQTRPVAPPQTRPVALPQTRPVAPPQTRPVALPHTQPVAPPPTRPVAEPPTRPVTPPQTRPVALPPTRPAAEPPTQPVTPPQTRPVAPPPTRPVAEPPTRPVTPPSSTQPVPPPQTQPVPPPQTRPVAPPPTRPVAEPPTRPVAEPQTRPVVLTTTQPVTPAGRRTLAVTSPSQVGPVDGMFTVQLKAEVPGRPTIQATVRQWKVNGKVQTSKDNPISVKLRDGKYEVEVIAETVEATPQELRAKVTVTVNVQVKETGEVKLEPTK
jgi:hypothetical protein